ncbi:MAG: ATP-binding protein, partial [Candidatus Izemoplasmatales bacterium]|nr:ATP-binding protein [Candidatus Izemoplasmatales bacterium]
IRTLVDFAGIIILYSQREHKLAVKSKMELNAMENLLNKQYEQYHVSQESIDIINQKYHDLKNQIIAIRAEKDSDTREKYLEDLENSIKHYEAQYKTGNKVLDTILTSKLITCLDNDINVTCIADGKVLDFIPTMDLCSIFGNALDNAIESVLKIDDVEKRLIKIAIYRQNELLLIRIENFYLNPLQIYYGNFMTTKQDTRYHGYGLKSIKSIVEKYDGSVSIKTDNNWFRLVILIPLPHVHA